MAVGMLYFNGCPSNSQQPWKMLPLPFAFKGIFFH